MRQTITLLIGAIFGVALVATCDHHLMATPDAGAQSGPQRVLTADTDASQIIGDAFSLTIAGQTHKVLDGPFVLTDADGYLATFWAMASGQDCTGPALDAATRGTAGRVIAQAQPGGTHGVRMFVAANETLCVGLTAGATPPVPVTWNGWRPY